MKIVILGGGVSGQLARHVLQTGTVLESRADSKNLTRMWGTNYLWEPIPFFDCESFQVITHVDGRVGVDESIKRYKTKIGKPEDIGSWGLQFKPFMMGWDFKQLPPCPDIHYQTRVGRIDLESRQVLTNRGVYRYDVLFNTIPLDTFVFLARVTHIARDTAFRFEPIRITVRKPTHADELSLPMQVISNRRNMYVNYVSDAAIEEYRWCYRDGLIHTETLERHWGILRWMGGKRVPRDKWKSHLLKPGKIRRSALADEAVRWLAKRGVFCFGRYASWEPNELVHETYHRLIKWRNGML